MIKTKNDFNDSNISYLQLFRGDKGGESSVSIRSYAVYSYLVDQDSYPNNLGVTNKQIANRTGLDYSGIKKSLDELEKFGLLFGKSDDSRHFPKEPSSEMWNAYFSSIKNEDWKKNFQYDRLYIRKLDSGLSFNQCVVFSQLVAWRTEIQGKEIVKSTTYTGLSKKCRLCRKTIISIIEELKELDLIMVNTSDQSFAVWIPELTEKTNKFFLHRGEKNKDSQLINELLVMINGVDDDDIPFDYPEEYKGCSEEEIKELMAEDAALKGVE